MVTPGHFLSTRVHTSNLFTNTTILFPQTLSLPLTERQVPEESIAWVCLGFIWFSLWYLQTLYEACCFINYGFESVSKFTCCKYAPLAQFRPFHRFHWSYSVFTLLFVRSEFDTVLIFTLAPLCPHQEVLVGLGFILLSVHSFAGFRFEWMWALASLRHLRSSSIGGAASAGCTLLSLPIPVPPCSTKESIISIYHITSTEATARQLH